VRLHKVNHKVNQYGAYRPSVDDTLLPAVMDQQSRVFDTPPALDAAVNFNSFEYARYRHSVSDGDVAIN